MLPLLKLLSSLYSRVRVGENPAVKGSGHTASKPTRSCKASQRTSRQGMITIRTRCAIVLVILNTMLFTFAVVCFSMHVMDRASPAWKGGSGLPKMHQQFLPQRAHRARNRLLMKEDVPCTYNNTMTLFILSDGVNRERRSSLRRIYRGRRSVRNFCMKYFFVIYGELQKSEKVLSDYLMISSYIQDYVEPQKIHFAYKSKPKVDLKLKSALSALQDPTSSESSSEETTEDESEETVEETIEEDDTQKKNRTNRVNATLDALLKGRDVGKRHLRYRIQVTTLPPRNSPHNIDALLQALSTPNDVRAAKIPVVRPSIMGPNITRNVSVNYTGIDGQLPRRLKEVFSSKYRLRSQRDELDAHTEMASDEDHSTTTTAPSFFEGLASGVKSLFEVTSKTRTTTPTPVDDEEEVLELSDYEKEEKPRVTPFATRCDGRTCVPIEPPEPCNCSERMTERLAPDSPSRMNSFISISKIQDNRRLEEASSNSRWKVFVQDQQPIELNSLVAYLNHEAKVLAKLEPCCSSLDGCPGCNHMFQQKLLVSTKLVPTISTKDTFALEDDVRKILWNDPNDVILEFHVEPRGRKVTRYWKVFNM